MHIVFKLYLIFLSISVILLYYIDARSNRNPMFCVDKDLNVLQNNDVDQDTTMKQSNISDNVEYKIDNGANIECNIDNGANIECNIDNGSNISDNAPKTSYTLPNVEYKIDNVPNTELFCICRKPDNQERGMVQCDFCDEWYHYDCIKVTHDEVKKIDPWKCPLCSGMSHTIFYIIVQY